MDLPSKDIFDVILALVPGFLAAWVFYGLTTHPKKTPFERTIQALIFTLFVQGATFEVHRLADSYPERYPFGGWSANAALVWSSVNAILIGLAFAFFANNDWLHAVLRWARITKRTSYPSEWYSAFNKDKRWIILHLKGQRRLYGWPVEFADQADTGHFIIACPVWLLANNECAPLHLVERLLVPAETVEMVEMLKSQAEVTATEDEIKAAEATLVGLQETQEDENGKQSMAADSEGKSAVPAVGRAPRVGEAAGEPAKRDGSPHVAAAAAEEGVNHQSPKNGGR